MSNCSNYQSQFTEYFYDELDKDKKALINGHIESCEICRREYQEIKRTLQIMSKKENPEPGDNFWQGYWDNLNDRMKDEQIFDQESHQQANIFQLSPQFKNWTYRFISAAAMLLIGIGIGYLYFEKPWHSDSHKIQAQKRSLVTPAQQVALNKETTQYLESSKILLLGFVNFDTDLIDPTTMDFSRQQQAARSLIKKTASLKDDLKGKENQRVLQLIQELEILLLQISNYEKEFNVPAIDLIKSGVDNNAILMKINLDELIRAAKDESVSNSNNNKNKINL